MTMNKNLIIGLVALVLIVGAVATTASYAADQQRIRQSAQDGTCDGDQTRQRLRDRTQLYLNATDCLNCTGDCDGSQNMFRYGSSVEGAGSNGPVINQTQLNCNGQMNRHGWGGSRQGLP